jgi:hypothetical protein
MVGGAQCSVQAVHQLGLQTACEHEARREERLGHHLGFYAASIADGRPPRTTPRALPTGVRVFPTPGRLTQFGRPATI